MSIISEANRISGNITRSLAKIAEKGVTVPEGANSNNLEELISAIETGGGSGGGSPSVSVTSKDVNFIDYDGTLLYSYTVEEAQALTELPPLPSHDGLICQGWNYNITTIKPHKRDFTVGAMYITDDGKTRIYIHLEEGRTAPMLGCCPNGTVTVDWGDGSATETLTGTSVSTVKWTNNHQYANPGDYVITLTVDGSMGFLGSNSTNTYSGILRFSSVADARNRVYQNSVTKIEIGNGVTSIGTYAFGYCHSLASVSIPDGVTSIGNYAFGNCYSLASVSIPDGVTSIGNSAFQYCYPLASVSIPDSVTSIGAYVFQYCHSLASVSIPDGVKSIGTYMFYKCYSLASVSIPDSVTSIATYAFYECYSLASVSIPDGVTSIANYAFQTCRSLTNVSIPDGVKSITNYVFSECYGMICYDFTRHTTVPSLSSKNAFNGIPADCEIRVPAALADEWKAATNWSTYASQIVGV